MERIKAYRFTGDTLKGGRPIPAVGTVLKHEGEIIPCKSGLHASVEPFDALRFAPGPMLHLVEIWGDIAEHGDPVDKLVGRNRVILQSLDATNLMRHFARLCALDVIHLWDAPPVVREFLETGNEDLRAAARAATWDAGDDAWTAGAAARAAQRLRFKQMVEAAFKTS